MEPQNKRMRLGTKSCTECRRRKVKCMFEERQTECRQCKAHSLVCQSQYVSSPSSDDKDQMIQELTQFVGQVEKRMASMQVAIDTLASKLDSQASHNANPGNGAGTADGFSENSDQQDEILRQRLKSMIDDLPNRPTLSKILEYTQPNWMSWPLSTKQSFQKVTPSSLSCVLAVTFDAGFPMSTDEDSALSFIDNSLRSRDFGVISKCLIWLCLSFQKLPKDFKDIETGLPLRSQELITRYLATVETFYQVSSTPVCNIDFVEALILQYELFVSMGRLSAAWKCIRSGIENAMILGLYRSQSSLDQGVWEALWIRDRQLSLFLGFPYGIPEHLTLTVIGEGYPMPETEVFRKIATISGHISERDQLGQDAPHAETSRILVEMAELKAMIPGDWGTKTEFESAFSFAQVFVHTNIRLFYHTLNQMVHLPYARLTTQDRSYGQNKIAVLESAEGTIRAYQDMRALEAKPYGPASSEFFHFLAFSAATMLAADLASRETPRSAEEERRLWILITELTSRMKETCEILDSPVASQAAEILENFQAACNGTFVGLGPYVVTIPFFGRIKIRGSTETTQHHTRRHSQSEATKNIVEMETNAFSFRMPNEYVTEWELADDWSKGADVDLDYDWKGVYEFSASN